MYRDLEHEPIKLVHLFDKASAWYSMLFYAPWENDENKAIATKFVKLSLIANIPYSGLLGYGITIDIQFTQIGETDTDQ